MPEIDLPPNLLEEETEGLPGANPELVGKAFKLYFDKDNQVVKVEAAGYNTRH